MRHDVCFSPHSSTKDVCALTVTRCMTASAACFACSEQLSEEKWVIGMFLISVALSCRLMHSMTKSMPEQSQILPSNLPVDTVAQAERQDKVGFWDV